jgi:hypothetical protein
VSVGIWKPSQGFTVACRNTVIIIIIILFINCNWVVTQWQWLFPVAVVDDSCPGYFQHFSASPKCYLELIPLDTGWEEGNL